MLFQYLEQPHVLFANATVSTLSCGMDVQDRHHPAAAAKLRPGDPVCIRGTESGTFVGCDDLTGDSAVHRDGVVEVVHKSELHPRMWLEGRGLDDANEIVAQRGMKLLVFKNRTYAVPVDSPEPGNVVVDAAPSYEPALADLIRHLLQTPSGRKHFSQPVVEMFPDLRDAYLAVVDTPMDLTLLLHRIESGHYRRYEDGRSVAMAELQLVWDNARRYNAKTHPVVRAATYLESVVHKLETPPPPEATRGDLEALAGAVTSLCDELRRAATLAIGAALPPEYDRQIRKLHSGVDNLRLDPLGVEQTPNKAYEKLARTMEVLVQQYTRVLLATPPSVAKGLKAPLDRFLERFPRCRPTKEYDAFVARCEEDAPEPCEEEPAADAPAPKTTTAKRRQRRDAAAPYKRRIGRVVIPDELVCQFLARHDDRTILANLHNPEEPSGYDFVTKVPHLERDAFYALGRVEALFPTAEEAARDLVRWVGVHFAQTVRAR